MHPCRCNSSQLSDQIHGLMEGMKNMSPVLSTASGENISFHFVSVMHKVNMIGHTRHQT